MKSSRPHPAGAHGRNHVRSRHRLPTRSFYHLHVRPERTEETELHEPTTRQPGSRNVVRPSAVRTEYSFGSPPPHAPTPSRRNRTPAHPVPTRSAPGPNPPEILHRPSQPTGSAPAHLTCPHRTSPPTSQHIPPHPAAQPRPQQDSGHTHRPTSCPSSATARAVPQHACEPYRMGLGRAGNRGPEPLGARLRTLVPTSQACSHRLSRAGERRGGFRSVSLGRD